MIQQSKTLTELVSKDDENILNALRNSVYPGAKEESLGMVLAYCRAKKYDPLGKAVHIVPMSVKDSKTNKYDYRDVIMPGISSYRIEAERSGQYCGVTEPIFGEMITEKLGSATITYPEWCSVTVKKIVQGNVCEFTSKEYWKENYANKGKDRDSGIIDWAPNAMWSKRPRAQLAKCAEAQALRKAFPGIISDTPTFEEMEGKDFINVEKDISKSSKISKLLSDNVTINNTEIEHIRFLIEQSGSEEIDICNYYKIDCLESMTGSMFVEAEKLMKKKLNKKTNHNNRINNIIENEKVELKKEFEEFKESIVQEPIEKSTDKKDAYDW